MSLSFKLLRLGGVSDGILNNVDTESSSME